MAEVAEDCSPGRIPRMGAASLSIHAFKDFVGPARDRCAARRALAGPSACSASIGCCCSAPRLRAPPQPPRETRCATRWARHGTRCRIRADQEVRHLGSRGQTPPIKGSDTADQGVRPLDRINDSDPLKRSTGGPASNHSWDQYASPGTASYEVRSSTAVPCQTRRNHVPSSALCLASRCDRSAIANANGPCSRNSMIVTEPTGQSKR